MATALKGGWALSSSTSLDSVQLILLRANVSALKASSLCSSLSTPASPACMPHACGTHHPQVNSTSFADFVHRDNGMPTNMLHA